jgi:hypothetical protein
MMFLFIGNFLQVLSAEFAAGYHGILSFISLDHPLCKLDTSLKFGNSFDYST